MTIKETFIVDRKGTWPNTEYTIIFILDNDKVSREIELFVSWHYPTVRQVKNAIDTLLTDHLGFERVKYDAKHHKTKYSTRI